MADEVQPDVVKVGELAQKIVAILSTEASEVRRRAVQGAMVILGEVLPHAKAERPHDVKPENGEAPDLAQFFSRDESLRPSDSAQLCAAYHFSLYGPVSFSMEDLRAIAREAGVVLPDRLDKTLAQAAKGGKKLFQIVGKGAFKPTASAGLVFKERWNVRPGRRSKGTEAGE